MVPEYTDDEFVEIENSHGETSLVPANVYTEEDGDTFVARYQGAWFCRLTAPGYMDCTDWSGPFETLQQAREHIEEQYDVNADTGEELEA